MHKINDDLSHFSVRVFDLYIRDNIALFTEADYYMQGTLAACYIKYKYVHVHVLCTLLISVYIRKYIHLTIINHPR